jgi:hypothetical protein
VGLNNLSMMSIYQKIAEAHGVSAEEVKKDMQAAIDHAYKSKHKSGIEKAYLNSVPRKGEIPTPEEFIVYAVRQMKKDS